MDRRRFLIGSSATAFGAWLQAVPPPPAVNPIPEPHFPDRLHQFVWRNWELANADRMAQVVRTVPERILAVGSSMGLPAKPQLTEEQLRRIYVTVIRQNWHLLPDDQLIELLGWSRERFEFTLKEDDFLDHKLGPRPDCPPVVYREPGPEAARRAAEIRRDLEETLGPELAVTGEAPFDFVSRLNSTRFSPVVDPSVRPTDNHVDISGWPVIGSDGIDRRILERFSEYLSGAMQARPASQGEGEERIEFRIAPDLPRGAESFVVSIDPSRVEISAGDESGLLQAMYWLQDQMEEAGGPFLPRGRTQKNARFDPRYVYSYFALYGDPLFEPEIDPFPAGYLEKLARIGVNGVWMQAVLSTLAPSEEFPEFGAGWQRRLETLRNLVSRAKQYGIQVYLYVNEPRARPGDFYRERPGMKGAERAGLYAMCTAVPAVREWISASLAHVFEQVPDLGGVFSISMSENLTNCFSKGTQQSCPRCRRRHNWQAVLEVAQAIRNGVRRSSDSAKVIIWDWGWPPWGSRSGDLGRDVIPKLPKDVRLLSVSEWDIPIERGGVKSKVGEYSISVVGPGPRAKRNWLLARAAGIAPMAKTQFNNTWEISAVPYIPVPPLIARHCANLSQEGVSGLMASWTLGGYPSPNLEVAKEFYFSPRRDLDEVLIKVAARRYGAHAARHVREAWQRLSEAFQEFPYGVRVYLIPTQHGPANRLRARPTGVEPSMLLFPQDGYQRWIGHYPPQVVRDQFARMAELWRSGLSEFRKAVELVPANKKARAEEDLAVAEVCEIHFQSVAHQVEFYMLRDRAATRETRDRMRELVEAELGLARRLYPLARRHSVIAFEASNHYYYRPLDLAETIIHCRYLLDAVFQEA